MIKLTLAIFLVFAVLNKSASSRLIGDISLVSDGVSNATAVRVGSSTVTCHPTYGFMPCATEVPGLLILVIAYHYLLSVGQKYISDGSDLFIRTFGRGIIGDNLFNILGTIPQSAVIIGSRLSGDTENAKVKSSIGISILAGGAILNLTFVWGFAILLGRTEYANAETSSTSYVKPSSLTGSGVMTNDTPYYMAKIRLSSVTPLLIIQLADVFNSYWAHFTVSICLGWTLGQLVTYYIFQIFKPLYRISRYDYLNMVYGRHMARIRWGFLLDALISGTQPEDEDTDEDNEHDSVDGPWKNYIVATCLALLGIAISCSFAGPLIESVVAVATASSIPSFFIPSVVLPITLTFKSAQMIISSAKKKTPDSISLALSQIYASVYVSNVMGLFVFSIVVYARKIPVGSSAEFLVLTIICTVMGVFTATRDTFPQWTSYVAMLMYPISLSTIYVLTTTFGWS